MFALPYARAPIIVRPELSGGHHPASNRPLNDPSSDRQIIDLVVLGFASICSDRPYL
jgi:hypothetical protein